MKTIVVYDILNFCKKVNVWTYFLEAKQNKFFEHNNNFLEFSRSACLVRKNFV